MASGDANELEKEVKSTGNDESDRIDEVDSSEDRESGQITKDVSAKKEVSLADILENPDKFPNMINIMIAMNKFPIDGGSVAKFLGKKFKQPVTPDTADKLLASVLLDMFRKISNDLNGIVLFENGEIDDEKSIQQAMEQGIPVPPGVNKETFEDKYKTALDIIRKDAEIFSVDRFVGDFLEKSMEKNAEYVHLDEIISPNLYLNYRYVAALSRKYYNDINKTSVSDITKYTSREMIETVASLNTTLDIDGDDENKPKAVQSKAVRKSVEEFSITAIIMYSELESTGQLPGKTLEEKIDNAIMMLHILGLNLERPGKSPVFNQQRDQFGKMMDSIVAKLNELTQGKIEPGQGREDYLRNVVTYKAVSRGELKEGEKLEDKDLGEYVKESMINVTSNQKIIAAARLFLQLEALKGSRLDPTIIIQKQNELLFSCKGLKEQLKGLYKGDSSGEYSAIGMEVVDRIESNIFRTSLDREVTAIEKMLADKDTVLNPEQKAFFGKVLLARFYEEGIRSRQRLGAVTTEDYHEAVVENRNTAQRLLMQLYPEAKEQFGENPKITEFASLALGKPGILKSNKIDYKSLIGELKDFYLGIYCHDVLLRDIDTVLSHGEIRDEDIDEMMRRSQDRININAGQVQSIDRLAKLTETSKIDFSGKNELFKKVYREQYVNSWVTKENVVELRYLELKLKHSQLKRNGANKKELKEVEDQMRLMEQNEGDKLREAFGSDDYKDASFDNYLDTIDGNLDGHLDAIKKATSGEKNDIAAVMFSEVVTFNKMKVESRVCQYFYVNVFRENADSHFTLTLEDELKDHMQYCVSALNIAKNYESEAGQMENPIRKAELLEKKELFEKMAYRGLEVISKGRKKPYIEFDENGKADVNEENLARRYCKAAGIKFTNTEAVLDNIYKNSMTLYPARKLDEYYGRQDELVSFKGMERMSDEEKFKRVILPKLNKRPTGKLDPKLLRTFELTKLNYDKVISCYRDRGLASTLAICAQKTLASWNLANKNSFGRQLFSKIMKKALGRYDANQTLPEGQADVRDGHNSEDVKMNGIEQRNAQENERQDFVQHVPTPTVPSGSDRDTSGDPQQSADQKESDGQEIV